MTPPGSPSRAVKVLVPALEVEGMSYHRIGPRGVRLLAERGDGLAGINAHGGNLDLPAGVARVPLTAEAEAELGGSGWFNTAEAERRLGRLYALYREPGEHVLAFSERAAGAAS